MTPTASDPLKYDKMSPSLPKKPSYSSEDIRAHFPKEFINKELVNACMNKEATVVEKLLEIGADVNVEIEGNTPLFAATYVGHLDIIKTILKKNPDISQPAKIEYSNKKTTPLIEATWLAFYSRKKRARMNIVKLFLKYILDKEKNETESPFKEPQKALNEGLYCSIFFKLNSAKEFLKVGAHLQALAQCQDARFTELFSRMSTRQFVVSKSKIEKFYSQFTLQTIVKELKVQMNFPKNVIKIFKEYYGNFNLTSEQLYSLECNEKFLTEKKQWDQQNAVEQKGSKPYQESHCRCIVM